VNVIFVNTGASSTQDLVSTNVAAMLFVKCVFHGARGSGFTDSIGSSCVLVECEAYDNNKSNTSGKAGFATTSTGGIFCYHCISHDNAAGVNSDGFNFAGSSQHIISNCIADTVGGNGVSLSGTNSGYPFIVNNCDFYNNT